MNNLGMAYLDGMGVEMDTGKAARYFVRAAKGGNAAAQYNLALLYVRHPGALTRAKRARTDALAMQWLSKSAQNGDPAAMTYLADVYRYGKLGQRRNPAQANRWQKQAASLLEKEKAERPVLPLPQNAVARQTGGVPVPAAKTASSDTGHDKYDQDFFQ